MDLKPRRPRERARPRPRLPAPAPERPAEPPPAVDAPAVRASGFVQPPLETKQRGIEALSRGFDVMETLAAHGELPLSELARLSGVPRATAFRVLNTLAARGYVDHQPEKHVYRLGPGSLILAAQSQVSSVVRMAEPAMRALQGATGETINLALVRVARLMYVEIIESHHGVRTMSGGVGQQAPWHATALGKAVLSRLAVDEARPVLGSEPYPQYTPHTKTTWQRLAADLGAARARGFAFDDEETDLGASCVAAPILAANGRPLGAISVAGLTTRFAPALREETGRMVAGWTTELSRRLGYVDGA